MVKIDGKLTLAGYAPFNFHEISGMSGAPAPDIPDYVASGTRSLFRTYLESLDSPGGPVRFLPRLAWAVAIVCISAFGGLVYLLSQRHPKAIAGF